jgi:hypothetical protein
VQGDPDLLLRHVDAGGVAGLVAGRSRRSTAGRSRAAAARCSRTARGRAATRGATRGGVAAGGRVERDGVALGVQRDLERDAVRVERHLPGGQLLEGGVGTEVAGSDAGATAGSSPALGQGVLDLGLEAAGRDEGARQQDDGQRAAGAGVHVALRVWRVGRGRSGRAVQRDGLRCG